MNNIKLKIYKEIERLSTPNKSKKEKHGEVFTAIKLVEEMLSKFDSYVPEVWKNQNLKWLDPCVGCGQFYFVTFFKLWDGLETVIPDELDRFEWIISKQLYAIELDQENYDKFNQVLGYLRELFYQMINKTNKKIQHKIKRRLTKDTNRETQEIIRQLSSQSPFKYPEIAP